MNELKTIIKQICLEKGISEESVFETINSALAAAYRKDFGNKNQNIIAEYDVETANMKIFDEKVVVKNLTAAETADIEKLHLMREARKEEMEQTGKVGEKTEEEIALEEGVRKFNPKNEIELKEAKKINKSYKVDDIIRTELEIPGDFGRMAAQTAKQVIIQKLREAERDIVFQNFKQKENDILVGIIQKREGKDLIIDLNHVSALLPANEQIRNEHYRLGDRVKVVLLNVNQTSRGPELVVSRADALFVEKLFISEIPEIADATITIKNIAREAGSRNKVSVYTGDDNIDPIGSCIGQRGSRIQTIINELNGEKIDIIQWDKETTKYISNALMPAKATSVVLDEAENLATVTVPSDQLSLTIGRDGQNVRLAVKLTGWKIKVKEQETGKEIAAESEDGTADAPAIESPAVATEETPVENK